MPHKIGDTIIYCYTTGEYTEYGVDKYGATSFNVKYRGKVYRTPSIVKCYQKIIDLVLINRAMGYVQFDDIKLLRMFKKIYDIDNSGWNFTPNKTRVPHYISNIEGELNFRKGIAEIWAEGDPRITMHWNKGKQITTTTYPDGRVETITE